MCWNVVVILYKYVHTHIFMLLYIIILHGHLISWINHWHPLPIRWKPRTRGAFGCTTTLGLVGYGGSIGGELFLLGSWVEKYGVVMLKWDDLGCFFKSSWDSEQDGGCLNVIKRPQIMIPSFDLRYSNVAMENPLFRRFFPMTSPFSSGIFQSATWSFRFWCSLREWSHDSRVPLRKRNREKRASTSWRALRPNLSLAQT